MKVKDVKALRKRFFRKRAVSQRARNLRRKLRDNDGEPITFRGWEIGVGRRSGERVISATKNGTVLTLVPSRQRQEEGVSVVDHIEALIRYIINSAQVNKKKQKKARAQSASRNPQPKQPI